MDARLFRTLLFGFLGILAVSAALMLVNELGSFFGEPAELAGQAEKPGGAEAEAERALAAAAASQQAAMPRGSMIPASRQGLSADAVNSSGAISVVRLKDFGGVAETPKDMLAQLNELAGSGKKKVPPVHLSDADMKKKVRQLGGETPVKLKGGAMPEMGRGAGQEGLTMFTAPVSHKVFKSSETWWAFANSHKCKQTVGSATGAKLPESDLANVNFSAHDVLVLVSVSELPNGIFRIVKLDYSGKKVSVGYKVDPMAMAAGEGTHDFYTAAVVKKNSAVKLTQLP